MNVRPQHLAAVGMLLIAIAGCSGAFSSSPTTSLAPSLPVDPWGPLAVIPPQDGSDQARNEGTLRITDECVFLDARGEIEALFWPADRTRWSADTRTIAFLNFDATVVTVGDGDQVVLGGGGGSEAEGGIPGREWIKRIAWVARPAPACALDVWWFVGDVRG